MNYKFPLAALAASFALSACNLNNAVSGALKSAPIQPALTSAQVQQVDATYSDYQTRINNGTLTTTTPTGQATMAGYMGISNINPQDTSATAIGRLNMNVDFGAGTVTGSATDFGLYNGSPLTAQSGTTGSLNVAGTVSGSGISAGATGTLSDGSSNSDFNLQLNGSFYDDAGTLTTVGDVSGTMTGGGSTNNVGGAFYATKQ